MIFSSILLYLLDRIKWKMEFLKRRLELSEQKKFVSLSHELNLIIDNIIFADTGQNSIGHEYENLWKIFVKNRLYW